MKITLCSFVVRTEFCISWKLILECRTQIRLKNYWPSSFWHEGRKNTYKYEINSTLSHTHRIIESCKSLSIWTIKYSTHPSCVKLSTINLVCITDKWRGWRKTGRALQLCPLPVHIHHRDIWYCCPLHAGSTLTWDSSLCLTDTYKWSVLCVIPAGRQTKFIGLWDQLKWQL